MKRQAALVILLLFLVTVTIISNIFPSKTSSSLSLQTSSTLTDAGEEVVTTTYVDASGKPMIASDKGYASVRKTKKTDGKVVLEEYLDADGMPVTVSSGYSMIARSYTNGLNTTITYLDENKAPVIITSGYDTIHRTFNARRLADTDTYWVTSAEGEKQVTRKQGYARYRRFYNDDKKLIKVEYKDITGNPAVLSLGQSGYTRSYDTEGRVTVQEYIDADGKPMNTRKGYSRIIYTYTESGKITQYQNLNGVAVTMGKNQYGILSSDDQKVMLDEEGNTLFRLDNILNTYPYLVLIGGVIAILLAIFLRGKARMVFVILYLGFVIYMTMAWREQGNQRTALLLFSSYRRFFSSSSMRRQINNNIWLFIPLGVGVCSALKNHTSTARAALLTTIVCILISVGIEIVQYVAGIGLAEVDDVVSNGLGGVIGAGIAACYQTRRKNEKA